MTDKISREELRKHYSNLIDEQFDIIFPRKFYYTKYYYAFKHRLNEIHFHSFYADADKQISEAKLIACYDHSVTKDLWVVRDYVLKKFGKELFK